MQIDTFFDILFPGDENSGAPSFSQSDQGQMLEGFYTQIDNHIHQVILGLDKTEVDINADELIELIKTEVPDLKLLLNNALAFYFSRPDVVIPLTGRRVPLTTSGMAEY